MSLAKLYASSLRDRRHTIISLASLSFTVPRINTRKNFLHQKYTIFIKGENRKVLQIAYDFVLHQIY